METDPLVIRLCRDKEDLNWTPVNHRKRPGDPEAEIIRQTKLRYDTNNDAVITTNRYQALENEENENQEQEREEKPPPIFIPLVMHYQSLINELNTVGKDSYQCKIIGKDQIKLQCSTPDIYRKVVKLLQNNKTAFHTYQLKNERNYRVVLKNMHYSIDVTELKNEIESYGHKVANIHNVKHRITKTPLSMFFIDLYPAINNKSIYEIKALLHTKIIFEAPYTKKEIVQCTNCQRYGHTKTYCHRQPRCVKCGRNHHTKICDKKKETEPTCVLCNGNHPANYKGCTVYKEIQTRKYPPPRPRQTINPTQQTTVTQIVQPDISYAQIARGQPQHTQHTDNKSPEHTNQPANSNKLEDMMTQLMQRMDTMLNLLTILVSKMSTCNP